MKKILIVEDEVAYLEILAKQLSLPGVEVFKATDGGMGLRLALEKNPDLIVLDVRMPVMDGLTMLRKLREDPAGKGVKVIILTNLDDSATISGAMNEKMSKYMVKSDSTLAQVVESVKLLLFSDGG